MLKTAALAAPLLLAGLAAMTPPARAQGAPPRPSFACARTSGVAERTICGDAELARLDRIVADLYAESRSLTLNAEQADSATADQRAWLARRNRCTTVQCLRSAHFGRIAELARGLPES